MTRALRNILAFTLVLFASPPGQGFAAQTLAPATEYSFLDAYFDASSPDAYDCIDLRISGICTYLAIRVYVSLFGVDVDVSPEFSVELSHYNPDLLVSTYNRLGGSPLDVAQLLFDDLQNSLTKPVIELVTGKPVPSDYADASKWGAVTSETSDSNHKSTLQYNEVDIVGHPGNALKIAAQLVEGKDASDAVQAQFAAIPQNVATGMQDQATRVPEAIDDAADDIDNHEDRITDISGWEDHPIDVSLVALADNTFLTTLAQTATLVQQYWPTISTAIDAWNIAATTDLDTLMQGYSLDLESLAPDEFQEFVEAWESIEEITSSFEVGGSGIDKYAICPSSADIMKPYFLSGFDLFQWRFNIPEMVFPQSYAISLIPGMHDLFVGEPTSNPFTSNAWGSIYPRNGFLPNGDEMKAGATNAFRAAHVVTRPNQIHVYSHLEDKDPGEELKLDHPGPLLPRDETTGKWQLMTPQPLDQCVVFGDDDTPSTPWTKDKISDDNAYVYTLWREYVCCPYPKRKGSTYMEVVELPTIPLNIRLLN